MRGECYICKFHGADLLQVTSLRGRHADCYPGSKPWQAWYEGLDPTERDAMNARSGNAAQILYNTRKEDP